MKHPAGRGRRGECHRSCISYCSDSCSDPGHPSPSGAPERGSDLDWAPLVRDSSSTRPVASGYIMARPPSAGPLDFDLNRLHLGPRVRLLSGKGGVWPWTSSIWSRPLHGSLQLVSTMILVSTIVLVTAAPRPCSVPGLKPDLR